MEAHDRLSHWRWLTSNWTCWEHSVLLDCISTLLLSFKSISTNGFRVRKLVFCVTRRWQVDVSVAQRELHRSQSALSHLDVGNCAHAGLGDTTNFSPIRTKKKCFFYFYSINNNISTHYMTCTTWQNWLRTVYLPDMEFFQAPVNEISKLNH